MSQKEDNNLFKVTNEEEKYVHWFTSLQRVAVGLGIPRNTAEYYYLKKQLYKGYTIELVNGSEVKYKNIN